MENWSIFLSPSSLCCRLSLDFAFLGARKGARKARGAGKNQWIFGLFLDKQAWNMTSPFNMWGFVATILSATSFAKNLYKLNNISNARRVATGCMCELLTNIGMCTPCIAAKSSTVWSIGYWNYNVRECPIYNCHRTIKCRFINVMFRLAFPSQFGAKPCDVFRWHDPCNIVRCCFDIPIIEVDYQSITILGYTHVCYMNYTHNWIYISI